MEETVKTIEAFEKKSNGKVGLILGVVVALVAAGGAAGYCYKKHKTNEPEKNFEVIEGSEATFEEE